MKKYLFPIACLFWAAPLFATDEMPKIKTSLDAVTIYRTGAEMTHTAKMNLQKGNSEVIITNLSNSIDINSVQIKSGDNVTLMGIEFNTDNLKEETKTLRVQMLEDSLEKTHTEIDKLTLNENIAGDLLSVLKSNKENSLL